MKSFSRLIGCAVLFLATGMILIALQLYARSNMASKMDEQYVVGVVATASEDEWHAMMLENILNSAAAQGFDVITLHSARSTDAQAEQVRALIIYQVDAIVLSPVAETGWDYVFQERMMRVSRLSQSISALPHRRRIWSAMLAMIITQRDVTQR